MLKATQKLQISSLPLPPPTHLLTANLTPDIHTPSVSAFRDVLTTQPTIQRRSRLLDPQCHFSYVSPLPLPFPYQVSFPPDLEDKAKWVESWLSAREAIHERPLSEEHRKPLSVYYPENREQPRELVGLSRTGLNDCLPLLDVGDAFESLGVPSLVPLPSEDGTPPLNESSEAGSSACKELVDVLSGHALLMSSGSDESCKFAPWALRYSGHQFGSWAGQLGDGRAISVREYTLFVYLADSDVAVMQSCNPTSIRPRLDLRVAVERSRTYSFLANRRRARSSPIFYS
jgi:hypothetical protein